MEPFFHRRTTYELRIHKYDLIRLGINIGEHTGYDLIITDSSGNVSIKSIDLLEDDNGNISIY